MDEQIAKAKCIHERMGRQVDIEALKRRILNSAETRTDDPHVNSTVRGILRRVSRGSRKNPRTRLRLPGAVAGVSGTLIAIGILYVVSDHNLFNYESKLNRGPAITKTSFGAKATNQIPSPLSGGETSTLIANKKLGLIQPELPQGFYIVRNQILHPNDNPHLVLDISDKTDATKSIVIDEFITSQTTFPKGMGKFNTMRVGNISVRVYSNSNKFVRYEFIARERYFDITTKNVTMSQAKQVIKSLIK